MKQTAKHVTHPHIPFTYRRNGVFYFCYRIPKILHKYGHFPQIVRRSLKTKHPMQAKRLAIELVGKFESLQVRLMSQENEEFLRINFITVFNRRTGNEIKFESDEYGTDVEKLERLAKSEAFQNLFPSVEESTEPQEVVRAANFSLKDAAEKWLAESTSHLTSKALEERERHLNVLCEVFPNHDINLDRAEVNQLLTVTKQLPRGNILPYCKMLISERVQLATRNEVPKDEQISNSSHFLKTYQGFFHWLVSRGSLEKSPMEARTVKPKTGGERGPLDIASTQKLVDYAAQETRSDIKWSLLIMAYTGMRNGEVLGLQKRDVCRCDSTGVWYFRIRQSKTKSSIRRVPIAQCLLKLGLLQYVDELVAEESRLFDISDKYLTKAYPKIWESLGLPKQTDCGSKLSLHSLRHTVISLIRSGGANEFISKALVGHQASRGSNQIHDGYSHTSMIPLDRLKVCVDALPYYPKVLLSQ